MIDNLLAPQHIFHYARIEAVNDTQVNQQPDSIVILTSNADKKMEQIRVLPFNTANVDKYTLNFADKVQYFRKEVREQSGTGAVVAPENTAVVSSYIPEYFDATDGFDDEFADFMDGFNNKPATGFGDNINGIFTDVFVDISESALNQLQEGLT